MAKKKTKKVAKCRSGGICNGCAVCEKSAEKGPKLLPPDLETSYQQMNTVDPRFIRADMSVLFLNPGPQALTTLVGAGDWLQRGLKEGTGIKGEVTDHLTPMPLARLATPSQLWDPSPARGHPLQVRSTGLSAASRGQVVLSNLRLKAAADGGAKIKATLAITGPLCRCVEQLFSEDRDFEFLEQITVLSIPGPFDSASLKLWSSVHLQGIQFNLEASPYDLWFLEGSQYLRILFGWRSMVWTPVDLWEATKEMPPPLPNSTAEQILLYLMQKALLDNENQEVEQKKEDEKEASGDELEEDSEEEVFQWKTVPWSVRKKRKIRKDTSNDSWSYSPLPPAFKVDSLLEVGAAHQNLKLKLIEKVKIAAKTVANSSNNNNNSGMLTKNQSLMEVDPEEQQRTVIQAHNMAPKPLDTESPSMPAPGRLMKNPERSQAKRLCTIAEHGDCRGQGDNHKKTVFATSTPSVAATVEKEAVLGASSYVPSLYRPAVDRYFPRVKVGAIREEKLDGVEELTALLPSMLTLKTASSELPARWNDLASSANFNARGKKTLAKIQRSIAQETDPEAAVQECKQILAESQQVDIDVLVGDPKDGRAGYYRMTPREALNALQSGGTPLVLRSGRQVTALHKVIKTLSNNIYQLDLSSLTPEEKAIQKRSILKHSVGILEQMADDDVSRHGSSVEKLVSDEVKEKIEVLEKLKAEGQGELKTPVVQLPANGAGGGTATPAMKTRTQKTRILTKLDGSEKPVDGKGKTVAKTRHTTGSSHNYESIEDGAETGSEVDETKGGGDPSAFLTANQSTLNNELIPGVEETRDLASLGLSALEAPLANLEAIHTLEAILKGGDATQGMDVDMTQGDPGSGLADHTVGAGRGAGGMSLMEGGQVIIQSPTLKFGAHGNTRREVNLGPGMNDSSSEETRVDNSTQNVDISG